MSIRKHVAVLLSFVFSVSLYAQSGGKFQVTGNVSDSDGEPLAGVTVSVKEQPSKIGRASCRERVSSPV